MRLQKKFFLMLTVVLTMTFANAQDKPKSPPAVATAAINGANITINYNSPSVKGRVIWGELVPFDKIWRAGANAATTIETDKDIIVEGSKLPAGKYSFFVIPNEKECVLIFNKVAKLSGTRNYDEKEDQIRVTVKPQIATTSTEALVYTINENSIVLSWEKWNIPFSVK